MALPAVVAADGRMEPEGHRKFVAGETAIPKMQLDVSDERKFQAFTQGLQCSGNRIDLRRVMQIQEAGDFLRPRIHSARQLSGTRTLGNHLVQQKYFG